MSRPERADARIGELFVRLAGIRARDLLGLLPYRQTWRSAESRVSGEVIGDSSLENVREEERVWILTSFAAGEGQRVMTPGDDISERRYDRSVGIDLSDPGSLKLARAMRRNALNTGVAVNSIEGSAFTNVTGTSTVDGTDMVLDEDGNVVKGTAAALAAGLHQLDLYLSERDPGVRTVEGKNLERVEGKFSVDGDDVTMRADDKPYAKARTAKITPGETEIEVIARVKGILGNQRRGRIAAALQVRNEKDTRTLGQSKRILRSKRKDYDNVRTIRLTFQAKPGRQYRLALRTSDDTARGVRIEEIRWRGLDRAHVVVRAKIAGGATLASRRLNITGIDSSQFVGSLTFRLASTSTVEFEIERDSASHNIVVDRVDYSDPVELTDPAVMEFGALGRIWLVDQDAAAAPSVFTWAPATNRWNAIASPGPAGAIPRALAHSDSYEYLLLSDGIVYRMNAAGAVAYTGATTTRVGVAVGADRLWILRESVGGGTVLERLDLDATALPVAPTEVANPVARGPAPDTSITQRITGTPFGCAFFVNRATRCEIHEYNAGTDTPRLLTSIPGFKARAITHGGGYTWIAGEMASAGGGTEASVWLIDHTATPAGAEPLSVPLERRDDEPDTYIQELQFYGQQLYLLAHVASDPPLVRLWRMSLQSPGGLFLEHEVEGEAGSTARAMAVTANQRVVASSLGGPWVAQDDYVADGSAFLRSSLFHFRTLDPKALNKIGVDGEFPDGTTVEVRYSTDGGTTWRSAGEWTRAESKRISNPEETITFTHLALEVRLRTTVLTETPEVFSVEARSVTAAGTGEAGTHEHVTELIVDCTDESAPRHISGQQERGAVVADYLQTLADTGEIVEFEDFYGDAEGNPIVLVQVRNPDRFGWQRGQSLVRVQLVER